MSLIRKVLAAGLCLGVLLLSPLAIRSLGGEGLALDIGADVNVWPPGVGADVNVGGYGARGHIGGYYGRRPFHYYGPDYYQYYYPRPQYRGGCGYTYTNGVWIYTCP